jgi:hypothetical protein
MDSLEPHRARFGSWRMMPDSARGELYWPQQIYDNLGACYAEPLTLLDTRYVMPTAAGVTPITQYNYWLLRPSMSFAAHFPVSLFLDVHHHGSLTLRLDGTTIYDHGGEYDDLAISTALVDGLDWPQWGTLTGTWKTVQTVAYGGHLLFRLVANFGSRCTVYTTGV